MAMIHYLYVGHFISDGGFVRLEKMYPVVGRPLDRTNLSILLNKHFGGESMDAMLADWDVRITPDYIVCSRYGACSRTLQFVADFAEQEQASIIDMGSFMLIDPKELTAEADRLTQLQGAKGMTTD